MSQPRVLISLVIMSIQDNHLSVLLDSNTLISTPITRLEESDTIARDIFTSTTHIPLHTQYVEQLYTFFSKENSEVNVVYYILLPEAYTTLPKHLQWYTISSIQKNNKDHEIIHYAEQRLRWKIEYTNIVYSLLPELFTLSELQGIYESILNQPLDKRNFRKKILSLDFLKPTDQKKVAHARPALLYRFKRREPRMIKVFS